MTFDWDTWSTLAKDDPEAFERKRIETIEALISSASPELQPRLRGLQFRIDMERSRSSSPMGACVRINRMMWDSFGELRGALDDLRKELNGTERQVERARAPRQSATIVPFRAAR